MSAANWVGVALLVTLFLGTTWGMTYAEGGNWQDWLLVDAIVVGVPAFALGATWLVIS